MRKTWMFGATGAALAAVLGAGGCYDFDEARQQCIAEGRCEPEGVSPDAGDAGDGDAGFDAGCTPRPGVDLPDDAFSDSDCDGVDGEAEAGLFVDPVGGSDDGGAGTLTSPVRTLGHALALLRDAGDGPRRVYLAGGAYDEGELVLDVPASLHGGYIRGSERWERAGNNPARVDGGTVGLTVRNLTDASVVLEYLHVRSANAVGPGEPSIALRVLDASGVELRHLTLEAGAGATGAVGGTGTAGTDGRDGGAGTTAVDAVTGAGGPAPQNLCSGSDRSGGRGGNGVFMNAGAPGAPGKPDAGGGDGGAANTFGTLCEGTGECNCNGFIGGAGSNGSPGAAGPSGAGGMGLGTLDVTGGTWQPDQQGDTGEPGLPGEGGGGGGSGGACSDTGRTAEVAASGAGGGGGGGGCGGTGGQGGGGGGASIALLLINSQVTVSEGTQLRTLGGGTGGTGGQGGPGGRGGEGGIGGGGGRISEPGVVTYITTGGRGGIGGRGGDAGSGGAGGGGGGGPSVGVWCGPDAGVALTEGGVTFTLAEGGAGGASTGNAGVPGEKQNTVGCQDP